MSILMLWLENWKIVVNCLPKADSISSMIDLSLFKSSNLVFLTIGIECGPWDTFHMYKLTCTNENFWTSRCWIDKIKRTWNYEYFNIASFIFPHSYAIIIPTRSWCNGIFFKIYGFIIHNQNVYVRLWNVMAILFSLLEVWSLPYTDILITHTDSDKELNIIYSERM